MISRREVVTAGVLGTFATGAAASPADAVQDNQVIRAGLTEIKRNISSRSTSPEWRTSGG